MISELLLNWSSSTVFKNSPYFRLYHLWRYDTILRGPQHFRVFWVNHSDICIPMTLPVKAAMSISCVSDAVCLRVMRNLMQINCFFKSTIRRLWGACIMLKNTHPLINNAECYGRNSHHTDSNDCDITEPSGRRLITYHSWSSKWVQKLPGTRSCSWVFRQSHHSHNTSTLTKELPGASPSVNGCTHRFHKSTSSK